MEEVNGGAGATNFKLGQLLSADVMTIAEKLLGLKNSLDMTILTLHNPPEMQRILVM
jgi:hypothetical protein